MSSDTKEGLVLEGCSEVPTASPVTMPRPRPWGFWASTGWVLLIRVLTVAVLSVGLVIYILLAKSRGAAGSPEAIASGLEENGFFLALSIIGMVPFCLGGTALASWLRGWPVKEYLGLTMPTRRQLLLYLGGMAILIVVFDVLMLISGHPIVPASMIKAYRTAGFAPLLVAAVTLLAPLSEEFVFRGFLFRGYAASEVGPTGAVLFTGVVFGSLHAQYDWIGIIVAILIGIYLGWVRLRTGSTGLTIIIHAACNVVATAECIIAVEVMGRT